MTSSAAKSVKRTTTNEAANESGSNSNSIDTIKKIKDRISNELVIGLCGAIGSGIEDLCDKLQEELESINYIVKVIKISSLITKESGNAVPEGCTASARITFLQQEGNLLRKEEGQDYLGKLAIRKISTLRSSIINEDGTLEINDDPNNNDQVENKTKKRVAYIINQLKHPDEVRLLRTVYPKNFYLISLIRTEKERRLALDKRRFQPADIDEAIRIDRKEKDSWGQQVEKTSSLADYFMRNQHSHSASLSEEVRRFCKLVHGSHGMSPRRDERGMSAAYFASLQSACLSRQVGAAITDDDGSVISTGCNDVPAYGGGLYKDKGRSSRATDFRCIYKEEICFNDFYKSRLKDEIGQLLQDKEIPKEKADDLAQEILKNTKAADLIEYSRAIHAEMDAITNLARSSNHTSSNKTIYCTTYPCHNCARHIVAAGLNKVVYIEPYEKSLALQLHSDAITDAEENNKVSFQPYEGVSPSRYNAFFKMSGKRKDENGRAISINIIQATHVDPQYLDPYHAYEDQIIGDLEDTPS
ncbi:MAG: anti-phage dCTP deaminase [Pseudomonadota bacterium]|jgi:deoxycytidylate deaminase|nr:anti-phage dCTP deaminase [Pseudomonadota bacterium]